MTAAVDLSADLGEGFGSYTMADDRAMLEVISSANVACGFHAGDPRTMDATVAACRELGVGLGAHPGYQDLAGFGRRAMDISLHELTTDVLYQLGALAAFATRHAVALRHIAPHGRLGNMCVVDELHAVAVVDAVTAFDPELIVVVVQEGELSARARAAGLRVAVTGFADRGYEDDGTLVDRRRPGALIHDPDVVAERVVRMVTTGTVLSRTGRPVPVRADTVLVHGDTPGSVALARRVRAELEEAGVTISPLHEVVAARSAPLAP